jgi:hypothetical protein
MPQLELLQAEDVTAQPTREPVGGARTDAAEADNDGLEVVPLGQGFTSTSVWPWYS